MLQRMRSDLWLLVLMVVLSFAMHFAMAVQCRADMKANDQFNTYLKPGFVLFSAPFPRSWVQGTVLGAGVYLGSMLLNSTLVALVLFCLYEVLRRVTKPRTPEPHSPQTG